MIAASKGGSGYILLIYLAFFTLVFFLGRRRRRRKEGDFSSDLTNSTDPKVDFPCANCGTTNMISPKATSFQCRGCRHVVLFFECKQCKKVFFAGHRPTPDGDVSNPRKMFAKMNVTCFNCGARGLVGKLRQGSVAFVESDPEPMRAFYQNLGIDFGEVLKFKNRKVIDGELLNSSGISGLTSGVVAVSFDEMALFIHLDPGRKIQYEKIKRIEVKGRGQVLSTSNAGFWGGGFGLKGAAEGVFAAAVINSLTTKTKSSVESILAIAWDGGSLVLLNRKLLPEEMAIVLAPFIAKVAERQLAESQNEIEDDGSGDPLDVASSLSRLVELHSDGHLTDKEFDLAKRRILSPKSKDR